MPLGEQSQLEFRVGQQLDVAPHLIDARAAFQILNSLLDDDGSIYKRGGSVAVTEAAFGTTLRDVWDGWLQPGRRTLLVSDTDFGVLAADGKTVVNLGGAGLTLPKGAVAFQDLLFIGGGTIYGGSRMPADYAGGTIELTLGSKVVTGEGTAFTKNVDAGMLLRVAGGRIYVVAAVKSETGLELRDAYEGGPTGKGIAYTLNRLETATAPYLASDSYAVAGQRLIVFNGRVVRFSEIEKPHVYQAVIPPEMTVVQNEHVLPEGIEILGAESIGVDKVLVFHTGGITAISNLARSIVDGQGNSQHRIDVLSRDTVLWGNGAGIAFYNGALVVPGLEDVALVDGVSAPTDISQSIRPLYRRYIQEGFVPGNAFVYRNHYFLPILDSGGEPQELVVCRLDRPVWMGRHLPYRWPWTSMSGSGASISGGAAHAPVGPNDPPQALAACSDGKLLNLASFFEPTAAVAKDHDHTTPAWALITRDIGAGNLAIARFRRVDLIYEMEGEGSEVTAEVGTGARLEGLPEWDIDEWDEFEWADAEEVEFDLLEGAAPPNVGTSVAIHAQNAWDWALNERARYTRYRFQCADPVAKLTVRGVAWFVATPGGVRHTKVVD